MTSDPHEPVTPDPGALSYTDWRQRSAALVQKLTPAILQRAGNLPKVAQRLGIRTAGKSILVNGPQDTPAFMDYCFFEWPGAGRPLIETINADELGLNAEERGMVQAMRLARPSLFQVRRAQPDVQQLSLSDLLAPERPEVTLTDVSLTQTVSAVGLSPLIYVRVLILGGFQMSTGLSLVFPAARQAALLESWRQRAKKTTPETRQEAQYIFFFEKSRQWGVRTEYQQLASGPAA